MADVNHRDKLKEIRNKLKKSKKAWTRSLPMKKSIPVVCQTGINSKNLTDSQIITLGKCQLEFILQLSSQEKNSGGDSFFHTDLENHLNIFETLIQRLNHPIEEYDGNMEEKLNFFDVIWNYFINQVVNFSSTKIPALLFSSSQLLQDEFVLQILTLPVNAFFETENSIFLDVLKESENWIKIVGSFHRVFNLTNGSHKVLSSLQSFTNYVQKTLEFDVFVNLYPPKFSSVLLLLDRLKRTKKPQLAKNSLIMQRILFLTNEFLGDFDRELGKFLIGSYPLLSSILKNIIKVKNDQLEFIHFTEYPHLFHIFFNSVSQGLLTV